MLNLHFYNPRPIKFKSIETKVPSTWNGMQVEGTTMRTRIGRAPHYKARYRLHPPLHKRGVNGSNQVTTNRRIC